MARKGRGSTPDGRTTRRAGYAVSRRRRKPVEEPFGWMKTVGGLAELRHRGEAMSSALHTFACAACNLVRMRKPLAEPALAQGNGAQTGPARPPGRLTGHRTG